MLLVVKWCKCTCVGALAYGNEIVVEDFTRSSTTSSLLTEGTHTHPFNGPFFGQPRWAGTRKVKPIWILLKQETVSGSGISWDICKSATCSRQITMPAPTTQFFTGRMPFLPPNQQCQSTEGTLDRRKITHILRFCHMLTFWHKNTKFAWHGAYYRVSFALCTVAHTEGLLVQTAVLLLVSGTVQ